MAHYKCGGCRVRVQVSGQPAGLVGELCPECGSRLEGVVEVAELLGFRRIRPVTGATDAVRSASHEGIAEFDDGDTSRAAFRRSAR